MFNKSIEYIYKNISTRVKEKKKLSHLRREDIFPSDPQLLSRITSGIRDNRHPYLMSSSNAEDLVKHLDFNSVSDLLWGGINWEKLSKLMLHDLTKLSNSDNTDGTLLYKKLSDVLRGYVPFAIWSAKLTTDPSYAEANVAEIEAVQEEAIRWTFYTNRDKEKDSFVASTVQIDMRLKESFETYFQNNYLSKFDKYFIEFAIEFFTNLLNRMLPSQSSLGVQAYNEEINFLSNFEELSLLVYSYNGEIPKSQKDTAKLLEDYQDLVTTHLSNLAQFQKRFDSTIGI